MNFKSAVRRLLPQVAVERARYVVTALPRTLERSRTHQVFEKASPRPEYIKYEDLVRLQDQYPPKPEYGYSSKIVKSRGIDRAIQILRLPGARNASTFLELGCSDGMVSAALSKRGKTTTAMDARSDNFDDRARQYGTRLIRMDAASMTFEDDSFDFVFSYDAFEHFAKPEAVLQEGNTCSEAERVYISGVRTTLLFSLGRACIRFDHGTVLPVSFHLGRTRQVYQESRAYADRLESCQSAFPSRLQKALAKVLDNVKRIRYFESLNLSHLNLIKEYPSCFVSKSSDFENFTVSSISVLFQRIR